MTGVMKMLARYCAGIAAVLVVCGVALALLMDASVAGTAVANLLTLLGGLLIVASVVFALVSYATTRRADDPRDG